MLREEARRRPTRAGGRGVRCPTAPWVRALLDELTAEQRARLVSKQRTLQTMAADDFATRWELTKKVTPQETALKALVQVRAGRVRARGAR